MSSYRFLKILFDMDHCFNFLTKKSLMIFTILYMKITNLFFDIFCINFKLLFFTTLSHNCVLKTSFRGKLHTYLMYIYTLMRLLCTKFDREKNITVCKNKHAKRSFRYQTYLFRRPRRLTVIKHPSISYRLQWRWRSRPPASNIMLGIIGHLISRNF